MPIPNHNDTKQHISLYHVYKLYRYIMYIQGKYYYYVRILMHNDVLVHCKPVKAGGLVLARDSICSGHYAIGT